MRNNFLIRITSTYFCCGVEFNEKYKVVKTAPIVKWMKNKEWKFIYDYCKKKGWKLEILI